MSGTTRKRKYQSPFRIKKGCLVALRYRPRGNKLSVVRGETTSKYLEPVTSARFSEVWTDPFPGKDDGLALIGSRIRCFFPKKVLSEPYKATTRLLEGTVVSVKEVGGSIFADLLIDNRGNLVLSKGLPFLKRVDGVHHDSNTGKSELLRQQYEERIKGGRDKAVVRVVLKGCGGTVQSGSLEAKWVIRKRVLTKIGRRDVLPSKEVEPVLGVEDNSNTQTPTFEGTSAPFPNPETLSQNNCISVEANNKPFEVIKSPEKKTTTSLNKDFSLPVYIGDGNDSAAQQEGNWRWEAGRYHNPYETVLSEHPISKELLKPLSYNFVGEVVNIQPSASSNNHESSSSLAMVTIKPMVLPEHTKSGRLAHHGPLDLFDTTDLDAEPTTPCLLKVPIEELVIVHRKISRCHLTESSRKQGTLPEEPNAMMLEHRYSFRNDTYYRCDNNNDDDEEGSTSFEKHRCRRCQHATADNKRLVGVAHTLCESCFNNLKSFGPWEGDGKSKTYRCGCNYCFDKANKNLLEDLANEVLEAESKLSSTLQDLGNYSKDKDSGFISTRFVVKAISPVDFTISPFSLASFLKSSSSKPITKIKTRKASKKPKAKSREVGKPSKSPTKRPYIHSRKEAFRSTSARLLPYDVSRRKFDSSAAELYQWRMFRSSHSPEKPRNLRQYLEEQQTETNPEIDGTQKLQGRAARAKQRRLLKDVASMGVDVDTLATRETNVRFDRSKIHGWGVFTDVDIRQGEMIIEYRGDRIGNAVAEKREEEYEAAKIGSDYMFRVDEHTICDATKQGNVARFINASCAPNCHPKIILLDGSKRIVVYAKRDIRAGEELSYDYKFDLEYDPAKRITCVCGAPECKGFLNWDNRYVAVGAAEGTNGKVNERLVET